MPIRSFLNFAFFLLVCTTLAHAQQEAATITGEIKDTTGAVVPGATITITNTATGITARGESNEQGIYIVPSLKPGLYSLSVEKTGFRKVVRSGLTLQVNQVVPIDVELQTGSVTETVEISGGTPLLET
jgi:hypothetical protein